MPLPMDTGQNTVINIILIPVFILILPKDSIFILREIAGQCQHLFLII